MVKYPLLEVKELSISFKNKEVYSEIIKSISFELPRNSFTAIVGESGSGKSVTALALMGLLPPKLSQINSGSILLSNKEIIGLPNTEMRKIRGKDIAMIFQEPMSSLNPSMSCGSQVAEILKEHFNLNSSEIKAEVLQLFDQVKLPHPERIYKAYPHEISGGQKQRVMIAMAIACKPKLLIADEPTTALDVTVQKEILDLLKDIQKKTQMSVLFISHDLALVSQIADKVIVMYKGEIVEQGSKSSIFNNPKHRYTKALIGARPSTKNRVKLLPTISDFMSNSFKNELITTKERQQRHKKLYKQQPLLEVNDVEKAYITKSGWLKSNSFFKAVNGVSFKVYPGETLGLVGESGCGKSTLGNIILQLDKATAGIIRYKGKDITNLSKSEMRRLRKDIQIIFQDPFASLNPRLKVGEAILEPMKVHNICENNKERKLKVMEILKSVGLSEADFDKFPHQFSGGQRQRIGIARTIALNPKLIICDESVSALDISVQAQVLNLLNKLKDQYRFTYIFISHDLSVVKYMADQLLVMNEGKIEEIGEADEVFSNPKKPYTKRLINAIPDGID
jgi:peptide/nickel transport system ATP-binding protein